MELLQPLPDPRCSLIDRQCPVALLILKSLQHAIQIGLRFLRKKRMRRKTQ
jgi:hypothetical protein